MIFRPVMSSYGVDIIKRIGSFMFSGLPFKIEFCLAYID